MVKGLNLQFHKRFGIPPSIGRLIRDEKDRGVAIILDKRAPRFKRYIKDLDESKNLLEDIRNFIDN